MFPKEPVSATMQRAESFWARKETGMFRKLTDFLREFWFEIFIVAYFLASYFLQTVLFAGVL